MSGFLCFVYNPFKNVKTIFNSWFVQKQSAGQTWPRLCQPCLRLLLTLALPSDMLESQPQYKSKLWRYNLGKYIFLLYKEGHVIILGYSAVPSCSVPFSKAVSMSLSLQYNIGNFLHPTCTCQAPSHHQALFEVPRYFEVRNTHKVFTVMELDKYQLSLSLPFRPTFLGQLFFLPDPLPSIPFLTP